MPGSSTGELLEHLGHEVIERDPAYGMVAIEFVQTWVRGIYEESLAVPDRSLLERSTRQMAGVGSVLVPPRRRGKLLATRGATTARILELWQEVDVLLTPRWVEPRSRRKAVMVAQHRSRSTARAASPRSRRRSTSPASRQSRCRQVLAQTELPLSVQLVGRPGAEDVLYSLAGQIEAARPWADEPRPRSLYATRRACRAWALRPRARPRDPALGSARWCWSRRSAYGARRRTDPDLARRDRAGLAAARKGQATRWGLARPPDCSARDAGSDRVNGRPGLGPAARESRLAGCSSASRVRHRARPSLPRLWRDETSLTGGAAAGIPVAHERASERAGGDRAASAVRSRSR